MLGMIHCGLSTALAFLSLNIAEAVSVQQEARVVLLLLHQTKRRVARDASLAIG